MMRDRIVLAGSLLLLAVTVGTYDPVGFLPAAVLLVLAGYVAFGGGR